MAASLENWHVALGTKAVPILAASTVAIASSVVTAIGTTAVPIAAAITVAIAVSERGHLAPPP
jgi:hypothetical protein